MANYTSSKSEHTIEEFPDGYPRFAALMSTHPSFHVFRRFIRLRSRLLLYKQDSLVTLEKELDRIDREETHLLFLGNRRRDRNAERATIMQRLEGELECYDALVKRNSEIMCMENAKQRDTVNIRNWVNESGCITKTEMEYLNIPADLMAVGACTTDRALSQLHGPVEDIAKWLLSRVPILEKLNLRRKISQETHIFILPDNWANVMGRTTMACFLGLTIIIPVIAVESIHKLVPRIIATFFGTTLFIALLSFVTRARTAEMFIAGATYATVLTVFISNSAQGSCPSS